MDAWWDSASTSFSRAREADPAFWLAYAREWFTRSWSIEEPPETLVEALQRNRFELRPDPVRIVREELAEVREQVRFAAGAGGNAGIDVQRIVGIERGQPLRIVAGPRGQPALRELRSLGGAHAGHWVLLL